MTLCIRINAAGAGGRIMTAVGDKFDPELHHCLATYRGSDLQGGFVLSEFTGASALVSDAGFADRWCTRDLLWMVFDYAFVQLGLRKLFAKVASTNHVAMAVDLRAGWRIEAVLRDALPDAHLYVLSMERDACKWLACKPKNYRSSDQPEVVCG